MVLAVDFKQLPPATSRPPFIAGDPDVIKQFRFRVLRQNRRIATSQDPEKQEHLETFHAILEGIAYNVTNDAVRRFFVEAYARGALPAGTGLTQKNVPLEDNTAVFPMRRFRNRWNKEVSRRSAIKYKRVLH